MSKSNNNMKTIGIIGVNGLVGKAIIKSLEKLDYNNSDKYVFYFYGTSDGVIMFNGFDKPVRKFTLSSLAYLDYCILATDNNISRDIYSYALKNRLRLIIIDNSSEFRLVPDVPLCIPEINAVTLHKLTEYPQMISNPNCVTTILCMCLKPLLTLANIKKIIVSTYQSASGAGYSGLLELEIQTKQISTNLNLTTEFWQKQYVYNVFSHNTKINKFNLYNEEELKLVNETKKILEINPKITATCIRVPTLRSHCISAHIEFDKELEKDDIVDKLKSFPGVKILDDINDNKFPEPIITSDKTDIYVGRIRSDIDDKTCWNFFISGDQLLKGAGYNSVQILDFLLK
jgi:aspartate-semialdehyde dehydrogenase